MIFRMFLPLGMNLEAQLDSSSDRAHLSTTIFTTLLYNYGRRRSIFHDIEGLSTQVVNDSLRNSGEIVRAETLNPVLKILEIYPNGVYTNSTAVIYEMIKISGYY